MSFRGRFEYTIDDKGRVNIPSPFREQLQESGQQSFFITNFYGCLYGYTEKEWYKVEEKLSHISSTDVVKNNFVRVFLGSAVEVVPDKQGRILIPSTLRNHAKLEKDVVFLGLTKRFEIWSLARWQEEMTQFEKMPSDPVLVKEIIDLGF